MTCPLDLNPRRTCLFLERGAGKDRVGSTAQFRTRDLKSRSSVLL